MAIVFRCPACGATQRLDNKYVGLEVYCIQCSQPLVVPSDSEPDLPPPVSLPKTKPSSLAHLAPALCVFPFTFPIGLIVAILAKFWLRKRPELSGHGETTIGLGFCLFWFLLTIWVVFFEGLGPRMEPGTRSRCASNLHGLAICMRVYANTYSNQYPAIGYGKLVTGADGATRTEIDTQAALWLIVTEGNSSADVLVCPHDRGAMFFKGVPNPANPFPMVDSDGQAVAQGGSRSWSYSYQVPNAKNGVGNPSIPNNNNNTKFAILADRAPDHDNLFLLTSGLRTPTGRPITDWKTAEEYLKSLPATGGSAGRPSKDMINSPNHGGDGQNVLFQDGHVRFYAHPFCGINDDNIYTVATSHVGSMETQPDVSTRVLGVKCCGSGPWTDAPTSDNPGPIDNDDSVLVNINQGVPCKP